MITNEYTESEKVMFTVATALNSIDRLQWDAYKQCFVDGEVVYDYTSLNGGEPYRGTTDDFIDLVINTLPGYVATSHQSFNPVVRFENEIAIFESGVIGTHYLPNDEPLSDYWQAIGLYTIKLKKIEDQWLIYQQCFQKTVVIGDCIALREMAKKRSQCNREPRAFEEKNYKY